RTAACEMQDGLLALRAAEQAAAATPVDLAFTALDVAAADRALAFQPLVQVESLRVAWPLVGHHADHLRNHVAGAPHDHRVADAHVLAVDLVLVVQGGV